MPSRLYTLRTTLVFKQCGTLLHTIPKQCGTSFRTPNHGHCRIYLLSSSIKVQSKYSAPLLDFLFKRTASCYSVDLHDNHLCVENSMKNHCPICYEYLFDSVQSTAIMRCGHTMHKNCFDDMLGQNQYRCPICSKSVCNMSRAWERLDEEIEGTVMPEEYHYEVQILCNDCNSRSEAFFHIFGHKCRHCNSYNTRVIKGRSS